MNPDSKKKKPTAVKPALINGVHVPHSWNGCTMWYSATYSAAKARTEVNALRRGMRRDVLWRSGFRGSVIEGPSPGTSSAIGQIIWVGCLA